MLIAVLLVPLSTRALLQAGPAQQSSVQDAVGVIQGTVSDPSGKPASDAVVKLVFEDTTGAGNTLETVTDASSRFVFPALRTGTYTITAEKSGQRSHATIELSAAIAQTVTLVLGVEGNSSPLNRPSQEMEFSDKPTFTVAGVTDWTAVGGHGSDSTLRTSEDLARETLTLQSQGATHPLPGSAACGSSAAALAQLRAALEAAPDSYAANHDLGEYYLHAAQYSQAIPFLESPFVVRKAKVEDEYDLALACRGAGDFKRAREHVQHALTQKDTAALHRLAGDLDEKLGEPLAAVQQDERAVRMDPSEDNYFAWGSELLLHRAVWQARDVFRDGAQKHPTSARLLTAYGTALFAGALYEEAAQKLCQASDLNPADPEPYTFLGKVQLAAPDPLPCVEQKMARFAQTQPANPAAQYLYAMTIYKRQDGSDSQELALLQKAVNLDPKYAEAYLQLGIIASAQHNFTSAINCFRQAIEADPRLAEAHYRLGVALDRTGDPVNARHQFEVHDALEKIQADNAEQQRRELKQFLVVLQEKQPGPTNQ